MWADAQRFLDDGDKELRVDIPQHGPGQRVVFVVEGTFTGTISATKADGSALTIVEATAGAVAGDPTAPGVYYIDETLNPEDDAAVLSFSAFTSGEAKVSAAVIPNA